MTLNTPAEISAWISERRKRYPTKARIAEAAALKVEADEQARRIKTERSSRQEQAQKRNTTKKQHNEEQIRKSDVSDTTQESKGNNVVAKSVESHLSLAYTRHRHVSETRIDVEGGSVEDVPDAETDDSDETSSSGSSRGSDYSSDSSSDEGSLDDPPLEQSSKEPVPAIRPGPPRGQNIAKPGRVCRYMLQSGRCKAGRNCRFRHEVLPDDLLLKTERPNMKTKEPKLKTRPSIRDRLLAQQFEQEDRDFLKSILVLGDSGFLD